VELISAAGLEPFYLSGPGNFPDKSYGYLPGNFCMYARSCLNQGFTLDPELFTGAIFSNSCDSMERLCDIWKKYSPYSFVHLLDIPRKNDERALKFFYRELEILKKSLEKHFKCNISEDSLREQIELYNKARELFAEISLLRNDSAFYISSSRILEATGDRRNPEKLNTSLRKLLDDKDSFIIRGEREKTRILISGSVMADLSFVKLIESFGAAVVYEDFCSFNRFFEHPVDTSLPPLQGICKRYMNKLPCARFEGSLQTKLNKLNNLIETYRVDGVIFYLIKFCDIFSWETSAIVSHLREEKIPVLLIEGDYPVKTRGQTGTRIEAFLEMLEEERE